MRRWLAFALAAVFSVTPVRAQAPDFVATGSLAGTGVIVGAFQFEGYAEGKIVFLTGCTCSVNFEYRESTAMVFQLLNVQDQAGTVINNVTNPAAGATYFFPAATLYWVQVRITAHTSGTASVVIRLTENASSLRPQQSTVSGTVTANQGGTWNVNAFQGGGWGVSQGSANTTANAWPIKVTDATDTANVTPTGQVEVTTRAALTFNVPTSASVGVASGEVLASNTSRRGAVFVNTSTNTISCSVGQTAVLNSGITLESGAVWTMNEYTFATGAVNCIASAASSNLSIQEIQ